MFNGGKRAACLVSKDQNATVCFDRESGKPTYGERNDAASPWGFKLRDAVQRFRKGAAMR